MEPVVLSLAGSREMVSGANGTGATARTALDAFVANGPINDKWDGPTQPRLEGSREIQNGTRPQ